MNSCDIQYSRANCCSVSALEEVNGLSTNATQLRGSILNEGGPFEHLRNSGEQLRGSGALSAI